MDEPIDGVGVLRYPPGVSLVRESEVADNRSIAGEIASTIKKGTVITLPGYKDNAGNYLWDFRIEGGDPGQVRVERSDMASGAESG